MNDIQHDAACTSGQPSPAPERDRKIQQLFARLTQEIQEECPPSIPYFVVWFLCKHYGEHLGAFADIVCKGDPALQKDRLLVVEFFRVNLIGIDIAKDFCNAGYDTVESLETINSETLKEIESHQKASWRLGHKVRLQQIFSEAPKLVSDFKSDLQRRARLSLGFNYASQYHSPTPATVGQFYQQSAHDAPVSYTKVTNVTVHAKPRHECKPLDEAGDAQRIGLIDTKERTESSKAAVNLGAENLSLEVKKNVT
jgi:hypothetical protein